MIIFLVVFFLFLLGMGLMINAWSHNPHGRLDVKIALFLKYLELARVDLFEKGRSIEQIRAFSAKGGNILQAKPLGIRTIYNKTIPATPGPITVRVYSATNQTDRPIVIYCHGGGWVLGNLDSHDNTCRSIARKTHAVVVNVDYRLAPEHPFPAAIDDVYSAVVWVKENATQLGGDPDKIFIAGDSAGANLAAAATIEARKLNGPSIAGQILIYPVTDLSDFDTASYGAFAKGYYLTQAYMERFRDCYLPDQADWVNPRVSVLLEKDLSNLAPALVVTAQFDVLKDEGEAYARRLEAAGNLVHLYQVPGMIHGFITMDRILSEPNDVIQKINDFVSQIAREYP